MAAGKIKPVLEAFERELNRSSDLLADVQALRRAAPGNPKLGLPQLQLNLVRELAFLRCVLAWEVFLEDSFVVYLTGAVKLSGKPAKVRVEARTATLARSVLVGTQDFLSWSGNETVKSRANVWFKDGEPYVSALNQLSTHKEIRIVRNRIAHDSGEAKTKFAALRAKQVSNAASRKGMGPGAFLARVTAGVSRYDAYAADLRQAATAIAQD